MASMIRGSGYRRDIQVIPLPKAGGVLVIGCDSAGGVGPKPQDMVKVPGRITGKYTARVALMEVLAVGARPIGVVNTLCVEPEPSGEDIVAGIEDELMTIGLDPGSLLLGSTEKNIPTVQTGVGVTVVGFAEEELRLNCSKAGDVVLCVGKPLVGEDVVAFPGVAADLPAIISLRQRPWVHDIIPVGSQGILYEAKTLAELSGLAWEEIPGHGLDLQKSAGPSTCFLVTVPRGYENKVAKLVTQPVSLIGKILPLENQDR